MYCFDVVNEEARAANGQSGQHAAHKRSNAELLTALVHCLALDTLLSHKQYSTLGSTVHTQWHWGRDRDRRAIDSYYELVHSY